MSKKCGSLNKSLENSHINHTNSTFYKNSILWSIDRSVFASHAEAHELFCFPGDFYQSGTPDMEVTKSLHGDYGIEGKFASEWRDWRTLKGTLVRDVIEKKKCWKNVIFLRNNNSQHNPTASSDRQNLQSLVRCVAIVVDMRITSHTGPRQANATRTLTGCWLTARRAVALKLKILIQVVLLGPNWENALKIPAGCCQIAS